MQLAHGAGEIQHHLGHERAGLDVAAAFQLEHITLGAEHGAGREPLGQIEAVMTPPW